MLSLYYKYDKTTKRLSIGSLMNQRGEKTKSKKVLDPNKSSYSNGIDRRGWRKEKGGFVDRR